MDSIRKIETLTPDSAVYFVDMALRHFCLSLLKQPHTVSMVEDYKEPFQRAAKEYLAWENQQMRAALGGLEREQTAEVRSLFDLADGEGREPIWNAVEEKVNRKYGKYFSDTDSPL